MGTPGSAVLEPCDKEVDNAELEFEVLLTDERCAKDVVDVAKVAIAVLLADDPFGNNLGVAPPGFSEEKTVLVGPADSP